MNKLEELELSRIEIDALKYEVEFSNLKNEIKVAVKSLLELSLWLHNSFRTFGHIMAIKDSLTVDTTTPNESGPKTYRVNKEPLFSKNTKLVEMVMSGILIK